VLSQKEIEERLVFIARNGAEAGLSPDEIVAQQENFRVSQRRTLLSSGAWNSNESTMTAINYTLNTTYKKLEHRYALKSDDLTAQNTILEGIEKYYTENNKALALQAIQHYRQAQSNRWPLSLWWLAANDASEAMQKISTMEDRIKAYTLALENSIRGNNRNSNLDQDDGEDNRPICKYGLVNQLAQCMKEGYGASHPDNVYVPDLPEAVREWLPKYMIGCYEQSFSQTPIKNALDALTGEGATPIQIHCFNNFRQNVAEKGLEGFYQKYGHPESAQDKEKIDKAFTAVIDNLHFVDLPEPVEVIITRILNDSVPNHDFVAFIKNYSGLNIDEKVFYLSQALFATNNDLRISLDIFLNNHVGDRKFVKSEKFHFAYFIKMAHALIHNTLILVNLHGEIQDAGKLYFNNREVCETVIHNFLLLLFKESMGVLIHPLETKNTLENTVFLKNEIHTSANTFLKVIRKQNPKMNFSVENQKFLCMIFMLRQFDTYKLKSFIRHCDKSTHSPFFSDLYFLYEFAPELLHIIQINHGIYNTLFESGLTLSSFSTLAQINPSDCNEILMNHRDIIKLMGNKWLSIDALLQLARQNDDSHYICSDYLKHAERLIPLKESGIPFAMLLRGKQTRSIAANEISESVRMAYNFPLLISHKQFNVEKFYQDTDGLTICDKDFFMMACVKSKIFRVMINNPIHLHILLDIGFEFQALFQLGEASYWNLKALIDSAPSVMQLLDCQEITREDILHSDLTSEEFDRVDDVFYLINRGVTFNTLTHWPNIKKNILLDYRTNLIQLKTSGIDLQALWTLSETYPEHAVLILKSPEDMHSKWWLDRQSHVSNLTTLGPPLFELKLKKQYHIVFGLDDCVISQVNTRDQKEDWVQIFKDKNLYTNVKVSKKPDKAPLSFVFHPGFIELIRLLYAKGVKISFFSHQSAKRNNAIVEQIFIKAFDRKKYEEMKLNISVISTENINDDMYKDLEYLLKEGENLLQMVLIDYDQGYKHPKQNAQYMQVSVSFDSYLERILDLNHFDLESVHNVNNVFYMTGLLASAIYMAENNGISLSGALSILQHTLNFSDAQKGRQYCYKLYGYQTYYEKGLRELQALNPTLQLVKQGKLFADNYMLNIFWKKEHLNMSETEQKESYEFISPTLLFRVGSELYSKESRIQKAIKDLHPYGFTESLLRPFMMSVELDVWPWYQNTLIYFITGKHPFYYSPLLKPEQCLLPLQALNELKELSIIFISTLIPLFALGLTGDLLRTIDHPENFSLEH